MTELERRTRSVRAAGTLNASTREQSSYITYMKGNDASLTSGETFNDLAINLC
jgi:hypothetical protein